jgi:hypothetical protein
MKEIIEIVVYYTGLALALTLFWTALIWLLLKAWIATRNLIYDPVWLMRYAIDRKNFKDWYEKVHRPYDTKPTRKERGQKYNWFKEFWKSDPF